MTIKYRCLMSACFASVLSASAAYASPAIDFSTIAGSNNSALGATANLGGIAISAYETNFTTTSNLWLRKESTSDDGLGVCSSSETCPTGGDGGGDINELSNESKLEWIVLQRPADKAWSELWVSSLDGDTTNEQGTVYWSNTLGDLGTGHFSFQYPAFGGSTVFGDVLSLGQAGSFDPFADFVMFRAGADGEAIGGSHNNDYLVWGAALTSCEDCGVNDFPTPEPLTLSLFGAGLASVVAIRRRKKQPA